MNPDFVSASRAPTRLQIALWAGCVICMLLLALRDWDNYSIGILYDDALYALLPRSLLYAAHYGKFFVPPDFQQAALPFGFPLMLTPLVAMFPKQAALLRFVPLVASVANLSLLFWGWRRLTRNYSYWWSVALVAVLAFSPLTILFARVLFSEAVFLTWCLVVFFLVERLVAKSSRWDALALGAAAIALAYTRTIGWMIVATLALYVVYKLGTAAWRPLLIAALSAGVVLALIVGFTPVEPSDLLPTEYVEILTGANRQNSAAQVPTQPDTTPPAPADAPPPLLQRVYSIGRNVLLHLDATDWLPLQMENEVSQLLRATRLEPLKYLPSLGLLALLLWGAWRWYRHSGLTAFAIIVPPYLFVLIVWAWDGSRMFYPVQPQLVFAFLLGLYGILEWLAHFLPRDLAPRVVRFVSVFGIAGFLLASIAVNLRSNTWFIARLNRNVYSEWILTHTPADAVILTSEPATDYLYAERMYVPTLRGTYSVQDLIRYMRAYNITYVIAPALNNPRTDLVTARTGPIVRYNQNVQELVAREILQVRYTNFDADLSIFQIDAEKLAAEAE